MKKPDHNQVMDHFIDQHLDIHIQELLELCAQPSISARGEGILECASLVERILIRHGLEVQRVETPGNPVIIGTAPGRSSRTLMFYNHYDVQPPEPLELWHSPPFSPVVRDGCVFARGAEDDKGELICRLAALEAVRNANHGQLPCNVIFVVEGEEEVGSPNIVEFVKKNLDKLACDAAIWEVGACTPEGSAANTLGVRGVLGVELTLKTMSRDAHSGTAHILPNAAWRMVRLLNALKNIDEKINIPGFYDAVIPPTQLDLEMLSHLPTNEQLYWSNYGLREFVLDRKGTELNLGVFEPTCNIQGITSGYAAPGMKTVIPSIASVKLDFRLVPNQDPDDILKKLRNWLDQNNYQDVEIIRHGAMHPYKASGENPFITLTHSTGEEVYGKPTQVDPLSGGSSPIYAFAGPLGNIPVVFAGCSYWDNRAHAPDEHIRIEDFRRGARHIARILDNFAEIGVENV